MTRIGLVAQEPFQLLARYELVPQCAARGEEAAADEATD